MNLVDKRPYNCIEHVLFNRGYVVSYLQETLIGHDITQEDDVVVDTADQVVVQGVLLSHNSLLTSLAVRNELGNERIVVNADLRTFFDTSINATRPMLVTRTRHLKVLTECCG
jgi:hypothetical protein